MKTTFQRSRRGSALAAVLIIGLALLIICGALLRNALTERKLNVRTALRLQAHGLAEAVSEYGVAQARSQIEGQPDFYTSSFFYGRLDIPQGVSSLAVQNVTASPRFDVSVGAFSRISNVRTLPLIYGVSVRGSSPNSYYYDPSDPSNQFDPVKGRWLFRYDLPVLARASIPVPAGQQGPAETVCLKQVLSIRSIPVFAYAVFYNMDLEVNPGPQMDIYGNVHANGRLFARKVSAGGGTLNFHGQVTVTGGFYADFKVPEWAPNGSPQTGGTDDTQFTRSVANDSLGGIYDSGTWRDHKWGSSTESELSVRTFRDWSKRTFNGNLQTSAHDVQPVRLAAMGNYVEDPTPNNGVDNSVNDSHRLIEPPQLGGNQAIESQKYSVGSAIYIAVNPSATERTGHTPDGYALTIPARQYRVFARDRGGYNEIILPGQATSSGGANTTPNAAGPAVITIRPAEMYDLRRGLVDWSRPRSTSNAYVPRVLDMIDVDMTALKLAVDKSVNGLSSTQAYSTAVPADRTTTSAAAWASFIYNDQARLATTALTSAHQISYAPGAGAYNGSEWNGGVYIESVDAQQRKDSGVRLINGRGRVASKGDDGLTIATNDALYILGHYNADGVINAAGSSNSARFPESGETPCSVASDALTILSQPIYTNNGTSITQQSGWNDAFSFNRMETNNYNAAWQTTAFSSRNEVDGVDTSTAPSRLPYDITSAASGTARTIKFSTSATEISAAMLTGIVPSNKDGANNYSGGLHNYPRFLELHSATIVIRGSLVALFESRVATQPWSLRHYDAPTRLWGFNELFNQGKFPPLTPRLLSFRRASFSEIPPGQYDREVRDSATPRIIQ